MTTEDEQDADNLSKIINIAAARIGEHCDSVRIIVTKQYNGDDILRMSAGSGNYYAQLASVEAWVNIQKELIRLETAKSFNKD